MRCYSELKTIPSFLERYRYLKLEGTVGKETFGFDRWLNQKLYHSYEWQKLRRDVILRDAGCDLACPDHAIMRNIYIHHMNPISQEDIVRRKDIVLNPEYLITVSHETHNAIHYGDESLLHEDLVIRRPNDTCPWKTGDSCLH